MGLLRSVLFNFQTFDDFPDIRFLLLVSSSILLSSAVEMERQSEWSIMFLSQRLQFLSTRLHQECKFLIASWLTSIFLWVFLEVCREEPASDVNSSCQFSFQSQRTMANYHTIALTLHTSKVILKILQARLQQYMNWELSDVQVGFRKGRGPETKFPISAGP